MVVFKYAFKLQNENCKVFTFNFCTVEYLGASHLQLFVQRCLLVLLEERMGQQLGNRWPFHRITAHADFGKLVEIIGQRTCAIDLSGLRQTIADHRIGGYSIKNILIDQSLLIGIDMSDYQSAADKSNSQAMPAYCRVSFRSA